MALQKFLVEHMPGNIPG